MADKIEEPIIGDIVWYDTEYGVLPGMVTNVHRDARGVLPLLDLLIPKAFPMEGQPLHMTQVNDVTHGFGGGRWRFKGEQKDTKAEARRNDEAIYRQLKLALEPLKEAQRLSRHAPGLATRGYSFGEWIDSISKVLPSGER